MEERRFGADKSFYRLRHSSADGLAYHLVVCLILIAAQESGTLHPAVAFITNAQTIDSILADASLAMHEPLQ